MKEADCVDRIGELRIAKNIYDEFLVDPTSAFFGSTALKDLIKRTNFEISRLEELIYNGECEDSFETKE